MGAGKPVCIAHGAHHADTLCLLTVGRMERASDESVIHTLVHLKCEDTASFQVIVHPQQLFIGICCTHFVPSMTHSIISATSSPQAIVSSTAAMIFSVPLAGAST